MFWIWLAFAALVGLAGGMFLGFRWAALLMQPGIMEQNRHMAGDRNFALSVLRRELANWMFRRDPDRYCRAYKAAHESTTAIAAADPAEKSRQFAKLAKKYPFYTDFDLGSYRDYVLYADAFDTNSYEDIEQHYTDIIHFQALQAAIDENWPSAGATSDEDLEYLDDYALRFKDTLFKARMENALSQFRAYRQGKGDGAGPDIYETTVLTVRPVAHFAEVRYGIQFKDTGEFGLYGFFVADEGNKAFTSFYRSNAEFAEETMLEDIAINGPI